MAERPKAPSLHVVRQRLLTRREWDVAELVAAGMTNREIADRLFLSERTVEGHVAGICAKLKVRSRVQIATWVTEQPIAGAAPAALPVHASSRRPSLIKSRPFARIAAVGLAGVLMVGILYLVTNSRTAAPAQASITTVLAGLTQPAGVVVDAQRGRLFVAETGGGRVRVVEPDGSIRTIGSSESKSPSGLAVDSAGRLYIADTGNHRVLVSNRYGGSVLAGAGSRGFAGDFGPAALAELNGPEAVAVDADGNVYIADTGNDRVRMVDIRTGLIRTIAGGGDTDPFTGDYLGLYPLTIRLHHPAGIAVGGSGDVYIADTGANTIYQLPKAAIGTFGPVRRVAGNGSRGFSDGGGAAAARLNDPHGLVLDSQNRLYVADTGNNRIRRVDRGVIQTVAGAGQLGFGGDLGAATTASLALPTALSINSVGGIFVADTGNGRIRLVGTMPHRAKTPPAVRPRFPAGSYMAQIQARGKLVALVRGVGDTRFPFFAYRNPEDGQLEGFDVDMVKAVAMAIFGRDDSSVLDLRPLGRNERIQTMLGGDFDVSDAVRIDANPLPDSIDIADPYIRTVDLLLVRRLSGIANFSDLGGRTVCIVNAPLPLKEEVLGTQPKVSVVLEGNADSCLAALRNGTADAIYGHSPDTMALAAINLDVTFTGDLLKPRMWGYAMPKGRADFRQFLNGLVATMQSDGRWSASATKWLNGYEPMFNPQIR